jgi:hypothetical protein
MQLNLKDEPREWRKSALLATLGLALICSLLRWRHHLSNHAWLAVLAALAMVSVLACAQPRWFRGYHLLSQRVGFALSQFLGRMALIVFFLLIVTPVGLILRLMGQDSLRLKRPPNATTYWQSAKEPGPLDRLF